MKIVADASVVVKVLTEEADSAVAVRTVADNDVIVPDLIEIEVASALSKKVRYAGLPVEQATAALAALPVVVPDRCGTSDLIDRAFALSTETRQALYDCVYLALAEREERIVVTADEKFLKVVKETEFASLIAGLA